MTTEFFKSTGFRIKDLKISAKDGGEYDISALYEELNIFDSIMQPCITGKILIRDSVGLTNSLLFDGNEFLMVNIGKTNDDELDIKKVFRIYKQTNRTVVNQNSETYILHFVSEEFVESRLKRVCQNYSGNFHEAAIRIMQDYMSIPKNKIAQVHNSVGVRDIGILNQHPIEALNWMTTMSVDENGVPGFLFFENVSGFNFVSVGNLLKNNSITTINFNPKNTNLSNEVSNFLGARHFEVIQQFDFLSNLENGVYGGKFQGYDPLAQSSMQRVFKYSDINHPFSPENSSPAIGNIRTKDGSTLDSHFDASITSGTTNIMSSFSPDLKEDDPEYLNKRYDYENSLFQRKSIFAYLFSQRVKLVVPGNFAMTSGNNIFLNVAKYSQKSGEEDNLDKSLYGSYLIVAARHILTPDNKHETIFEACTNSSNRSNKNEMYTRSNYVNGDYYG
jgi:hypothetical protein